MYRCQSEKLKLVLDQFSHVLEGLTMHCLLLSLANKVYNPQVTELWLGCFPFQLFGERGGWFIHLHYVLGCLTIESSYSSGGWQYGLICAVY